MGSPEMGSNAFFFFFFFCSVSVCRPINLNGNLFFGLFDFPLWLLVCNGDYSCREEMK